MPVKANLRGFLLNLAGPLQCGQTFRHTINGAGVFAPLAGAFLLLDLFPVSLYRLLITRFGIRKDMRVAPYHLVTQHLNHFIEIEQPLLSRHLRMENHLQQQVAQLFLQFRIVPLGNRLGHFEGFFNGIRRNGIEVLLDIPRAAGFRVAQAGHDGEEGVDGSSRHAFPC